MKLRFQIGSNNPLAKRNARMFCAGSLPRKWSMRKIWSSEKTSCSLAFSATALFRSVPNGFSMMMRERSTRPASANRRTGRQGGIGRHAEIVHAPVLVAQFPLGLGDRRLERVSARADRNVVQRLGKDGPVRVLHLSRGELIERLARDLAEAIGVDLVERDADDSATGDEPGARQVEQAGQQLAPRQVAGGAHEDNNLRILGTNPRRNLCHACPPPS